jgi:AcrR family transcriptional regulator
MSPSKQEEIRRRNNPEVASELRKSERTRQTILDAAIEFLWSRPFRELTIAELMSESGSSRQTFYRYFADLHDLMESLLHDLEQDFQDAAGPWFATEEDPVAHLACSLAGVVKVSYQRGPLIRAVVEAAPMDERLEMAWHKLVHIFDDAVTARIEKDQAAGLVPEFDPRPVAIALNRMDVATLIHHFGRRPRSKPDAVGSSITRIWVSTIYGQEALARLDDD